MDLAEMSAPLDGMDTGGIRHVLVDDLIHRKGGEVGVEIQRFRDPRDHCFLSGWKIQFHTATGELVRIDLAEKDVGIRDRRRRSTPAIGGRARLRPALSGPTRAPIPST